MNPAVGLDRARIRAAIGSRRGILLAGLVLNIIFWVVRFAAEWVTMGMFYVVGVDWSRFWGAAKAFDVAGPRAGYDLDAIARFMQPFMSYYADGISNMALKVGPTPYPPIFLALFKPFTLPPPQIGFLLWTLANLALAIPVARALARRFPAEHRRAVTLLLLVFFPLVDAFLVGQLVIILLFAFWRGYEALLRGDEWRAGAWFALLLIKPQYAVVLLTVLLLKGRFRAIGGAALTSVGLLLSSLAVGGIEGIVAYVRMILIDYPNYNGGLAIDPRSMISWRALVLNLLPGLGDTEGLVLTALLSIVSLAMLVVLWRGDWNPRSPRFANQMLATMIVSLLVAYHSQVHGMVFLLVPGALLAARPDGSAFLKKLMGVAIFGPPFANALSVLIQGNSGMVALFFLLVLIMALLAIVKHDWTAEEQRQAFGPPVPRMMMSHRER